MGHLQRPAYHWLEPPREVPPPQGLVDTREEELKGPRARGPGGPFFGWGALGAGVVGTLEVHGALYVLGLRACKGLGGRGERRAEAGGGVEQAILKATMHSLLGSGEMRRVYFLGLQFTSNNHEYCRTVSHI